MSLFQQLRNLADQTGLRFLVIGGHAVIEHGFQRGTEDADILVSKEDRSQWMQQIESLGYRLRHDGGAFIQFEPVEPGGWELDLMLVPADVLDRLLATSKPACMEGADVVIPSLAHLLALKIHALKHGHGLRVLKDITDVTQLLTANRVDPKSAWLQELFEKHGDKELYERVLKLLS